MSAATKRPYEPPMLPPTPEDTRPPPLARVVRVENLQESTFRAGQRLGDTATIESGASALVLDLREGGRVTLQPQTTARVGSEAPAQVILASGVLHAELPPEGGSARPPLRVGTPSGSVVIEGSGEVWVAANAAASTFVAALSGRVDAVAFDDAGTLRTITLQPGQSLVLGAAEPSDGPRDADAARAACRLVIESASPTLPAEDLESALARLLPDLEAAEAEARRGEELQGGVRPDPGSSEAAARQRALVEHGRALILRRRSLLTRFEILRARALRAARDSDGPDPSAQQRPRVRAALGLSPTSEPPTSEHPTSEHPTSEHPTSEQDEAAGPEVPDVRAHE
ncbi:MAG: hypothetical protein MUE69_19875 [Myxococcota bacterium]|nr:hypothetical protein [Myxococcota bacterium]